jgi:hypothetical protein
MWNHNGTRFVTHGVTTTQRFVPPTGGVGVGSKDTINNNAPYGTFLQYSGEPALSGSWPAAHLEAATGTAPVAGIHAETGSVEQGFAWVVPGVRKLPLSGIYERKSNGLEDGHVVVIVEGNSFIFARTRNNDLQELKDKFAALTST